MTKPTGDDDYGWTSSSLGGGGSTTVDEDLEGGPAPKASGPWLSLISRATKEFDEYNARCDKIDKLYADLGKKSAVYRDREMSVFWASMEVLKPSVYARPPAPVVTARFNERDKLLATASEALERVCVTTFEMVDIDHVMRLIRDDMLIAGRGVAWVSMEDRDGEDYACVEHIDRKDFLHDPARNWAEVTWVARRAWLTKRQIEDRFDKKAADDAAYTLRPDHEADVRPTYEMAAVWEIWSRPHKKVIWVVDGCDDALDVKDPYLDFEHFFPCPRPAYSTLERSALMPVPDVLQYIDQLDEINILTSRISALSEAVKVKGLYSAGASDVGDALETALNSTDDRAILIPVPSLAAFGNGDSLVSWLPMEQIANTISGLVELRKQLINDVYEITGLSDIMRGATQAVETATAQQLKSQYGSIRVRDRQAELIRMARDITRLVAEVVAENYSGKAINQASRMKLPTAKELEAEAKAIVKAAEKQVADASRNPQIQAMVQQNPEQAQQMIQQLERQTQAQIAALNDEITIDAVVDLLREEKVRPFALEIETDSTIMSDENEEKARRAEFLTAVGGVMQQFAPLVQAQPQSAGFVGEVLKFALAPFRAGRSMNDAVDKFVEEMGKAANQERPNPEAEALKAEMEARQAELQMKMQLEQARLQIEQQKVQGETQAKVAQMQADAQYKAAQIEIQREESAIKVADVQSRTQRDKAVSALDMERLRLEAEKLRLEGDLKRQELDLKRETATVDAVVKVQQARNGKQADGLDNEVT